MKNAIGGALWMAGVSTLGDLLWANWLPHQRPIYGFAHGVLLLLCAGLYLGALSRKTAAGAAAGALIGFLATGGFYVFRPLLGYSGLFVFWIALWVALGWLNGRVLQRRGSVRSELIRSLCAAVGSGIAFYAISGIWFPFNPHGWDYAVHFVKWTVAYLPAFGALLLVRTSGFGTEDGRR